MTPREKASRIDKYIETKLKLIRKSEYNTYLNPREQPSDLNLEKKNRLKETNNKKYFI